jgi:hypothetical protein
MWTWLGELRRSALVIHVTSRGAVLLKSRRPTANRHDMPARRFANYVVSSSKPGRIVKLDGQEPFQGAANAAEAALQVSGSPCSCLWQAAGTLLAAWLLCKCWHAVQESSDHRRTDTCASTWGQTPL